MFGRKKVGERVPDNPQSEKNQWEQMAIDAEHTKTYNELLGLDPNQLSEEDRIRVVSFALEMIGESFGKNIPKERLEKASTNVKVFAPKEYDEEIDKLPGGGAVRFWATVADGFYYDQTDSVFIRVPRGKKSDTAPQIMGKLISTVVHETLHFVCEQQTERQSRGFNEGITELYTNRILARVGAERGREFYAEEQDFAGDVESIVSPGRLEKAYFGGDFSEIAGLFRKGEFESLLTEADEYFELLGALGEDEKRDKMHERLCSRINRYKRRMGRRA